MIELRDVFDATDWRYGLSSGREEPLIKGPLVKDCPSALGFGCPEGAWMNASYGYRNLDGIITILNQGMTDILAGQDLLIGTRLDLLIDDRVAGCATYLAVRNAGQPFINGSSLPDDSPYRQSVASNTSRGMTDILAGQDLLIGTRLDLLIDDRVAGCIRRHRSTVATPHTWPSVTQASPLSMALLYRMTVRIANLWGHPKPSADGQSLTRV
jgi:hypothetical protein